MRPPRSSGIWYLALGFRSVACSCELLLSIGARAVFVREQGHLHVRPMGAYAVCLRGFTAAVWQSLPWRDDRALLCADCKHTEANSSFLCVCVSYILVSAMDGYAHACILMVLQCG